MAEEDTYLFHQTPAELAKDLIGYLNISAEDVLYEPFRGEGAFYNHFPEENQKDWSEIKEGRDYNDHTGSYDWVITNPPFHLHEEGKKVNSFWFFLDFFSLRARKGIAFLGNDFCLSALTPKRMAVISARGYNITKIVVCNVKKWRGRYFFIVLEKKPGFFSYLQNNY